MPRRIIPVQGVGSSNLSDTFGADRSGDRSHKGIDIFADEGTPVVATTGGTIVKAGNSGGLGGQRVWVRDYEGLYHYYAHMSSIDVREGQQVEAGQNLGGVGRTGNARNTPSHLHYSVNPSSASSERSAINPYEYLTGAEMAPSEDGPNQPQGQAQGQGQATGSVYDTSGMSGHMRSSDFRNQNASTSDVMANIFDFMSQAARQRGGDMIDAKGLFGDIFPAHEPIEDEEDADEQGAWTPSQGMAVRSTPAGEAGRTPQDEEVA